jgi:hypothetical protein
MKKIRQINRATEELSQLGLDTQKVLFLSPKEILENYPKLIKSIVVKNGKVAKIELHKL